MNEARTSSLFRRGEMIYALWQFFSRHNARDPRRQTPPTLFITRARKMAEFGVPLSENERPGRPGVDVDYSPEHAFELGVALALQDTGLKQSEAAFFIRNIRPRLRAEYADIMSGPRSLRQRVPSGDYPQLPARLDDPDFADASRFLVFRLVEIKEAWNMSEFNVDETWKGKGDPPLIIDPRIHRGVRGLLSAVDQRAMGDTSMIVIELSTMAISVTNFLMEAPKKHRGRQ